MNKIINIINSKMICFGLESETLFITYILLSAYLIKHVIIFQVIIIF